LTRTRALLASLVLTLAAGGAAAAPPAAGPPHSAYQPLPITAIHADGWIRELLERQRSGLTGHIEAAGYPFDTCAWACPEVPGSSQKWWPYEQTSYYVDGLLRLGYLLDDAGLVARARKQTDYVLAHEDAVGGRLGPLHLDDEWWRWPYASFFRTFMTLHAVTGDEGLVAALGRHYLAFSPYDFADDLELANVEELCWLYGQTRDSRLLETAEKAYLLFSSHAHYRDRGGWQMDFASDAVPTMHAVVYMELVKIPAILYAWTGNERYLADARRGLDGMLSHHMLASGLPSATENFRGNDERAGHETCNTAVFPYTLGAFLRITGDAPLGDRIEKAVFNAAIGSVTKDFRALQYFSCPNQVVASLKSNLFGHHPGRMAFSPGHDVECCTGNVNRFLPYYVGQMWLRAPGNGVAAALYGASTLKTAVGADGASVVIREETAYPFAETVDFTVETSRPVSFPLHLRIPGWAAGATVAVNGAPVGRAAEPGTFFVLDRAFSNGDRVSLRLPMAVRITDWPHDGVGIERGPLVFSLPVAARTNVVKSYVARGKRRSTDEFPAFELFPAAAWNYGLSVAAAGDVEVVAGPPPAWPWTVESAPVRLRVKARRLSGWGLVAEGEGGAPATPGFPARRRPGRREVVELVPYGSTLLRVTVFPRLPETEAGGRR
jgi:uncharacterized protein